MSKLRVPIFVAFAVLCLAFIGARYRVGVLRDIAAETIT